MKSRLRNRVFKLDKSLRSKELEVIIKPLDWNPTEEELKNIPPNVIMVQMWLPDPKNKKGS